MKGIGGRNNMEEWKEYTIDSICKNIFAGGDASKYCHTAEKTNENNIPIYANSVEKEGLYGYCNKPVVKEKAITIAARGAGTGFVSYRKEPFVPIVRLITLIPQEEVDILFLYYMLKYKKITGDGSAIPQLTIPMIKKEVVSLPSIEEQSRISTILSSLDDKIELNNRINADLEEQAQALFRRWFVDFEFPNEQGLPYKSNGGKFVDSELGKIPEGWKIGTLSEIADYLNGLAMQKFRPQDKELGIPVLKIKELGQKNCDSSSDICSESIKPEYIVNDGDVIFSWSGTLKIDIWCGGICGLNQHLFKVTSKIYPKWFYYYWTKQHLNKFIRIAKDKAVTMGHIKREDLDKSQLSIPNNKNFRTMNNIIGPLLEKQITLNIENRFLIQLCDAILPKLMNNEIKI